MSNPFKSAFLKAGLVSADQAAKARVEERHQVPADPVYAEDQQVSVAAVDDEPLPSADPASYPESVLRWGAAGVELLGKERLIATLNQGMDGTGRGRSLVDNTIESAIVRKPRNEADAWRERLPNLGGRKGCPTFNREAGEVYDAVRGGAVDAYMAEQRELSAEAAKLTPPEINEGEDCYAYVQRLEAWAADKPDAVLKVMAFDAGTIARTAIEAREQTAIERGTALWNEACKAFDQTGDFSALLSAEKATGGTVLAKDGGRATPLAKYHALAHAKWAWPCVAAGHLTPADPSVPPSAEWLATQSSQDFVLRCSREAHCPYGSGHDFRAAFRARLLEISTLKPDANHVLVRGKVAIDHEGRVIPLSVWRSSTNRDGERRVQLAEEQTERLCSTQPSPSGWVSVRTVTQHGSTKTMATLYGPDAFKALEVARSVKTGGGVDVRPWLESFGRHPDKGFGRFYFKVQPGGAHSNQMMVSVDDRLRDRIELLSKLPDPADATFPEDVYYVPMRLNNKKDKGAHGFWSEGGDRAVCYKNGSSGVQMSRRYSGGTTSHRPTGTAMAWTISASTRKHDESMIIAVIGKGQQLHLDTGMAIGFDGEKTVEIPGGALTADEKPNA